MYCIRIVLLTRFFSHFWQLRYCVMQPGRQVCGRVRYLSTELLPCLLGQWGQGSLRPLWTSPFETHGATRTLATEIHLQSIQTKQRFQRSGSPCSAHGYQNVCAFTRKRRTLRQSGFTITGCRVSGSGQTSGTIDCTGRCRIPASPTRLGTRKSRCSRGGVIGGT